MIQSFPRRQAGENEIAIGAMAAFLFLLPGRQYTLPWKTHPGINSAPASTANLGCRNAIKKKFDHAQKNYIARSLNKLKKIGKL